MYSTYQVSGSKPPKRRRRPALSCRECRKRKIKCDRNEPCNRCTLSKRVCDYEDGPELARRSELARAGDATLVPYPSPSTASHAHSTSAPFEALAEALVSRHIVTDTTPFASPPAHLRDDDSTQMHDTAHKQGHASSDNSAPGHRPLMQRGPSPADDRRNLDQLSQRLAKIEQLLPSNQGIRDAAIEDPDSEFTKIFDFKDIYQLHDGKTTLNKTRVFGQSHWATTAYGFKRLTQFLKHDTRAGSQEAADNERLRADVRATLAKCKAFAKMSKSSRPTRSLTCPLLTLIPPSKELADQLATLYITRFESSMRVVHVPTFWKEYEQYWTNPMTTPDVVKHKVLLVLAAGASLYRNPATEDDIRSEALTWVYSAHAWISGPLEKDRLTIGGLQVQCLLALARQLLSMNGDLIFVFMGSVVRTAMQMGLNHDPKHFENINIFQSEIRRRLWATILELSVQASLDSGMPAHITYDDFDTLPPSNINDNEIDESTTSLENEHRNNVTDTSLQIFFLTSIPTRLDMIRRMNSVRGVLKYPALLDLSSKLTHYFKQVGLHIKHSPEDSRIDVFRHNFADLLLRRFLLSLHRPFAGRATQNPLFYYSRKSSIDLGLALLTPPANEDFAHLTAVSSGIFKNRMAHISLSIASELINELEEEGVHPDSGINTDGINPILPQQLKPSRTILINALEECRRQVLARVQKGDTNVRSHMMLNMVLTQANRIGPSDPAATGRSVLEAAKESLETTFGVMEARQNRRNALETDMTFVNRQSDGTYLGTGPDMIGQELSGDFDFDSLWQNVDCMIYGEDDMDTVAFT